jgi:hypothetical protein
VVSDRSWGETSQLRAGFTRLSSWPEMAPQCHQARHVRAIPTTAQTGSLCAKTFCPSCLSFHQSEHPKAASGESSTQEKRKTA